MRRTRFIDCSSLVLAVALLTSCSGSTPTVSVTQACTDYANAICQRYSSCSNGWYIVQQFGDLGTCVSQYQADCDARLALPSGQSPSRTESCAQALPADSCQDLYGNSLPSPCSPPAGSLASGTACAIDAQCESAFCAVQKDAVCGSCAAAAAMGADCSELACGPGMICLRTTTTCESPVQDGGSCLFDSDCTFGLACLGPVGETGSCQPQGLAGSACDPERTSGFACSNRLGFYCKRSSLDAGSCASFGQADLGQPCADVNGVSTVCIAGGLCQKSPPDAGEGMCLASAQTGQACDADAGPECLSLTRCVPPSGSGAAGTCTLPGSSTCQ